MQPVVRPDEVADAIRRVAELRHDAEGWRRRLAAVESPVATLAALRAAHVAEALSGVLDELRASAELVVAVAEPD